MCWQKKVRRAACTVQKQCCHVARLTPSTVSHALLLTVAGATTDTVHSCPRSGSGRIKDAQDKYLPSLHDV